MTRSSPRALADSATRCYRSKMTLPTIRTVPCLRGGYCQFTVAGTDDMLCRKCGGRANDALDQGAEPQKEGPDSCPPGPTSCKED